MHCCLHFSFLPQVVLEFKCSNSSRCGLKISKNCRFVFLYVCIILCHALNFIFEVRALSQTIIWGVVRWSMVDKILFLLYFPQEICVPFSAMCHLTKLSSLWGENHSLGKLLTAHWHRVASRHWFTWQKAWEPLF